MDLNARNNIVKIFNVFFIALNKLKLSDSKYFPIIIVFNR